jgi:hypothetical protein
MRGVSAKFAPWLLTASLQPLTWAHAQGLANQSKHFLRIKKTLKGKGFLNEETIKLNVTQQL